jgi:hypothetical protein
LLDQQTGALVDGKKGKLYRRLTQKDMKYALLRSAFIILIICKHLMCYLQVECPFWSENERSSRETPCRLSETGTGLSETWPGLRETSNRWSENSPLLSERVINKRTRTVNTKGALKYFLARPLSIN